MYSGRVMSDSHKTIVIRVTRDVEAGVFVAESINIPGLFTEAKTLDGLQENVLDLIPDLLELNGFDEDPLPEIPYKLMVEGVSGLRA